MHTLPETIVSSNGTTLRRDWENSFGRVIPAGFLEVVVEADGTAKAYATIGCDTHNLPARSTAQEAADALTDHVLQLGHALA
jgi:hypothetical protein